MSDNLENQAKKISSPKSTQIQDRGALIKEVCRLIRLARTNWDAHNNLACRTERERALKLYETLSKPEKDLIPQVLRVWLRYRSEKYFGDQRSKPKRKQT